MDDGSTDESGTGTGARDILRLYASRDARIRPLFSDHQGIVQALNLGLQAARGRYIARMDADDVCAPQRLELQAAFLERNPETALVACRAAFGSDPGKADGYRLHLEWTNTLLNHDQISLGRFRESPWSTPR